MLCKTNKAIPFSQPDYRSCFLCLCKVYWLSQHKQLIRVNRMKYRMLFVPLCLGVLFLYGAGACNVYVPYYWFRGQLCCRQIDWGETLRQVCYLPTMAFSLSICAVLITLQRTTFISLGEIKPAINQQFLDPEWGAGRHLCPLFRPGVSLVLRDEACSYLAAIQSSPGAPNYRTLQVLLLGTGDI